MSKTWKIAGINFDHMHMGDLLRKVHEHPTAEIVGICDETPARMQGTIKNFGIPADRVFTDYRECLEKTKPDLVLLCPATAEHALWTERVAPYGVHVLVEKPFAASLKDADAMITALEKAGRRLVINWPLRWYPPYVTIRRLLDEGRIGEVIEVHTSGGNRGPLFHRADKVPCEPTLEEKQSAWWYKKSAGGGSLLDYLGYGVTLGTWYHDNRAPIDVTCMTWAPEGLEVDEQSITIARYQTGLSSFQTRWGTFTDPWITQPQPKCGFVIKGTAGTIAAYDYDDFISLQTKEKEEIHRLPVDQLEFPHADPISHVLHAIETDTPIEGPLSPKVCRIGQQIVDTAAESARQGRTLPLLG
ncbi:MAG: gfo/Idh/MocA family oxidoreductase [Puniceicoccaceae bacterium]|nr:MAG: gfo/Idh/MocA family oxidoreductase [Puniceicoccaceae bacterium]